MTYTYQNDVVFVNQWPTLPFVQDDGGRAAAGYRGSADDCATRAIAIATGQSYQQVYDVLTHLARRHERGMKVTTAREGVKRATIRRYLVSLGWTFMPTMGIGTGCRVHLRKGELPMGRLVVSLSKHLCAVIDGVIRDTYDPSRDGTRCVYGYWILKGED